MSAEVVVAILGAGGLSAIVGAVVTGMFSKRKLSAEATDLITKAASGVVKTLQDELDRQVEARQQDAERAQKRMEELAAAHTAEREEWRRVLQLHVAWDAIAIAEMAKLGVELPPAPPLLPANQHVDGDGFPVA